MGAPPKRVWTTYRKLMGNLPGTAAMAVVLAIGPSLRLSGTMGGKAVMVLAALVAGLAVFHFTGLFSNRSMRETMARWSTRLPEWDAAKRLFVGFASKGYSGALDPHEDVGWLLLTVDTLIYDGERYTFRIPKEKVAGLGMACGMHVFLGICWVVVRGADEEGRAVELRFESRDADRMFSMRRANEALRSTLTTWLGTHRSD